MDRGDAGYRWHVTDPGTPGAGGATESYSPVLPDDVEDLLQAVLGRVADRELSLATAESCTGGMLASVLTDVHDLSGVFERGFVVYSEPAKCELLGLAQADIDRCGVVSEEVARAMAEGALARLPGRHRGVHRRATPTTVRSPGWCTSPAPGATARPSTGRNISARSGADRSGSRRMRVALRDDRLGPVSTPHPFHDPATHGFVRVAAATPAVAVGRPRVQRRPPPRPRPAGARRGRRPRRLPRAGPVVLRGRRPAPAGRHCTSPSSRALRQVARGLGRPAAGAARRRAAAPQRPAVQLRGGRVPRPGPRRGAEELPAQLPRVLREALVRPGCRHRRRRDRTPRARPSPSAPTCSSSPTTSTTSIFHVEICEDFWAATPPSSIGALAGALILHNLSASNIVIGKARRPRRCCARRSRCATAVRPTCTRRPVRARAPPTWPGTGRA